MATAPLVPNQIQALVQQITMKSLGLPITDASATFVRIDWPQQGQPGYRVNDDITFLRCVTVDDLYNRIRDVMYKTVVTSAGGYGEGGYGEGGYGGGDGLAGGYGEGGYEEGDYGNSGDSVSTTTKTTQYTRVWEIHWCVVGPNSFDNARKLRSRMFDQDVHDQFAGAQLYFITDPSEPQRVPDYFDGQWWEQVFFNAKFNENVIETFDVSGQTVISVELITENLNGVISDVTIEES
jgi:hypothetical protein